MHEDDEDEDEDDADDADDAVGNDDADDSTTGGTSFAVPVRGLGPRIAPMSVRLATLSCMSSVALALTPYSDPLYLWR